MMPKRFELTLAAFAALAAPGLAADVTVYHDQGSDEYLQDAPPQHFLDLSYEPQGNMATAYALSDGLVFTENERPLGSFYSRTAIPWWSMNRLNTGGSYAPTHLHFVDPADGTTPVAMTSFYFREIQGPALGFALLDLDDSVIWSTEGLYAGLGLGVISDTPFYSVFIGPRAANSAAWGDMSWGVPEPSALALLGLGGLGIMIRRGRGGVR